MEKDVFCKIIDGEIPAHIVYEDDDVIAILDISQVTKGHTLVISKKHYETMLSAPKEIVHKIMDVAQRIGQAQITNLGAKGVNILTNCYAPAGQSVPHFHVHVIPRYDEKDNLKIEFKNNAENINFPALVESIKKSI